MKERQQFGSPTPHVFVGVAGRVVLRLPSRSGLGDRLVGAGLVLAPDGQAQRFALGVGALNQGFLGVASGSVTVATPALRFRWAVPVGHQLRVRCQE